MTFEDLQNLLALVETTDGGPAWIHMMDKSLPSMSYQAWRRDHEACFVSVDCFQFGAGFFSFYHIQLSNPFFFLFMMQRGPPQYRSRTIFDDAKPETVRNFFWDDEFRMKNKWDDMLLYHESLEECPLTGTMVVHWIRKVRA